MTAPNKHGTVVTIGGIDVSSDLSDIKFDESVPAYFNDALKAEGPITISGTFDDEAVAAIDHLLPRELTIVSGRRFLWWTVAHKRLRQTVRLQPHKITRMDGMMSVSVPMRCEGDPTVIISPWWERALYHVARLWSWK